MGIINAIKKLFSKDNDDKFFKSMKFKAVVSYTTRPMRMYETDGKEHWFVNDEYAINEKEAGNVVAYTEIGPYKYFVDKKSIDDLSNNLYIIDPLGIEYLIDHYKGDRKFSIIYVYARKSIRDQRAKTRSGYDEDVYNKRCFDENIQFYHFEDNMDAYTSKYNLKLHWISNNIDDNMDFVIKDLKEKIKEDYKNNVMFLVVGRTCSGKDTICNELINGGSKYV